MAIKVQQGRVTGVASGDVINITPVADLTRVFVIAQFAAEPHSTNQSPDFWAGTLEFATLSRLGVTMSPGATATVSYFVVECTANEFLVEAISTSFAAVSKSVSLAGTFDLSKSFLVGTSFVTQASPPVAVTDAAAAYCTMEFGNAATAEFERVNPSAALTTHVRAFAVQWEGASVQHAMQSMVGDSIVAITYGDVDRSRSLLFASTRHAAVGLEQLSIALDPALPGRTRAQRFSNSVDYDSTVSLFVVELPVGQVRVQHALDTSDLLNVLTRDYTFPIAYDSAKSIAVSTASSGGTGNGFARHRWTCEVLPSGAVRMVRGRDGQGAELGLWIAEFGDELDLAPTDLVLAAEDLGIEEALTLTRADLIFQPNGLAVVETLALTPAALTFDALGLSAAAVGDVEIALARANLVLEANDLIALEIGAPDENAVPSSPVVAIPGPLRRGVTVPASSEARRAAAIARELREDPELPTLMVAGRVHGGWKQLTVERSLDSVAGSFQVEASDAQPFGFATGSRVEMRIGRDAVLTGWVDQLRGSLGAREHSVQLTGRSLAADLVDCSAIHDESEWFDIGLRELATRLAAPFSVPVRADVDLGEPFRVFALQQSESAWEALERACRLRSVLAVSAADGAIVLTRPGARQAVTALVAGSNVLSATLTQSDADRHAEYVVKGQAPAPGAFDEVDPEEELLAAFAPEGRAQDRRVRASRRLMLLAEASVDQAAADERARWEAAVRAARSQELTVVVNGWRQRPGGPLWEPGLLVPVWVQPLRVAGVLVIRAVRMALSLDGGRTTELSLVRAGAFVPQPVVESVEDVGADWFAGIDLGVPPPQEAAS